MCKYFISTLILALFCYHSVYAGIGRSDESGFNPGIAIVGEGEVNGSFYKMTALIGETGTRLQLTLPTGEVMRLHLTEDSVFDDMWEEQKISDLFARLVILGVLDPLFVLEVINGQRNYIYEPYMNPVSDSTIEFNLQPEDFLDLFECWVPHLGESSFTENILRQIIKELDASIDYTIHLENQTITQIDVKSQSSAPEVRLSQAVIHIKEMDNIWF